MRIIYAIIFCLYAWSVHANPGQEKYYLGFGGGIGNYNLSMKSHSTSSQNFSDTSKYAVRENNGTNVRLLLGYRLNNKHSFEVSLWRSNDFKLKRVDEVLTANAINTTSTEVLSRFEGLQLKYIHRNPLTTNTIFDYRLGLAYGNVNNDVKTDQIVHTGGSSTDFSSAQQNSSEHGRGTLGLGFEMPLQKRVSLRASTNLYFNLLPRIESGAMSTKTLLTVYSLDFLYRL